jgi:inorganic pyrophosphatase
MSDNKEESAWRLMRLSFKAHPWHGVSIGENAPEIVTAYIEIVPTDTVKYEMDKATGILKVDRPQQFSNICPAPYGLVPQTFCGREVGALFEKRSNRTGIIGDGDPLDICVLTEKTFSHSDILAQAIPIGGLSMVDKDEADDKIIAVMKDDVVYGAWKNISDCPRAIIDRLQHYFLTYKNAPGAKKSKTEITSVYGREEAYNVIRASQQDYLERFGDIEGNLAAILRG